MRLSENENIFYEITWVFWELWHTISKLWLAVPNIWNIMQNGPSHVSTATASHRQPEIDMQNPGPNPGAKHSNWSPKKAMSEQLTQKISNANLHLRFPQFSKGSILLKKMD